MGGQANDFLSNQNKLLDVNKSYIHISSWQKYELSDFIHILLKDIFKHFYIFVGNSIQCIQCGNQENSYQCTGSDSGRSTECPNNIAYCQKISALVHGLTFKQCGMISLPGIDQNEIFAKADLCVPNIVSF